MLAGTRAERVYLAKGSTDLRKSIDGLPFSLLMKWGT
jgi:hypothetical protein